MKSKNVRLFQFILIVPSLLFAFDTGPRYDRDLTFDNQYDLVSNFESVSMHTFSYSLAYKFENEFIFGFSLLTPSFGIRSSDVNGKWTNVFPSSVYALYAMYEFSNKKYPFLTLAAGVKTGYWFDDYQSPERYVDNNLNEEFIFPGEEFITECFGGPFICLSYSFKRFGFVAKSGVNFGTKTYRLFNVVHEPAEFAVEPEFSLGLRLSTYTSKDSSGKSESIDLRSQAVYLEILGLSFDNIFSLNYEYIIADHLALRAGFSFWMYDTPFFRFPFSATYLVGKEHLRLEFGAGTSMNFPEMGDEKHIIQHFFPICGIRHYGEKTGIIWRLSYTPFFIIDGLSTKLGMFQWPSFSIGYSFPRR
jgi:hypothetical protein